MGVLVFRKWMIFLIGFLLLIPIGHLQANFNLTLKKNIVSNLDPKDHQYFSMSSSTPSFDQPDSLDQYLLKLKDSLQNMRISLGYESGFEGAQIASNRAVLGLADKILNMNSSLFKALDSHIPADSDGLLEVLVGALHFVSFNAMGFTAHEFGHWGRQQSGGRVSDFSDWSKNPFLFYLRSLPSSFLGSQWANTASTHFSIPKASRYYDDRGKVSHSILNTGGGFHMDMEFAHLFSMRIYEGKGLPADAIGYFHSKLYPFIYPAEDSPDHAKGDPKLLSNQFQSLGWSISDGQIRRASAIATVLSASTWNYFRHLKNYKETAYTTYMKPFEIEGFLLPEMYVFYTRGISYRISSAYRLDEKGYLTFSAEKVFEGDTKQPIELSLGAHIQIDESTKLKAQVRYGKAFEGSFRVDYSNPSEPFGFYLGMEYHDASNLHGARNIYHLKDGDTNYQIFGGVHLNLYSLNNFISSF